MQRAAGGRRTAPTAGCSAGHWRDRRQRRDPRRLGDDFIYLGGGHDVAFGDAEDDEIIGGWGNDWISGGTGQDAILGDDGRIFTSRNSDAGWTAGRNTALATNCIGNGNGACFSEPLYGITAFRPVGTCPENKSVLCGDYLNQYISTPGEVQTASINIRGDLKKTVDLTPFNVAPNAFGSDELDPALTKFDANNSDDVIFGGLGGENLPLYPLVIGHLNNEEPPFGQERGIAGDFLHGGSGDDAIAGGEAIWNGYTQLYNRTTGGAARQRLSAPTGPARSTPATCSTSAPTPTPGTTNGPIVNRLGEFALYDEYDPRRTIMLNANGTVNKDNNPGANVLAWFLNLYSDEGPVDERLRVVRPERDVPDDGPAPERRLATRSSATTATTGWSAAPVRTRCTAAGATTCSTPTT